MLNRWAGIVCVLGMLSANTALVFKDFLPAWMAGQPPENDSAFLRPGDKRQVQLGIFDSNQRRVGRSWTVSHLSGAILTVETWTALDGMRLPNDSLTPRIRVHTRLTYQDSAFVDTLKLEVEGLSIPVALEGELAEPSDFGCRWQIGDRRGSFILNADETRALGDVIRPFDRLPGLFVGKSWRVKLMDPLNQLVPGWNGHELEAESMLVRVTALESIEHAGRTIEAHRVEGQRTTAWVGPDGRVLRQEVDLPLLGKLALVDEPFSEEAYRAVRNLELDLD